MTYETKIGYVVQLRCIDGHLFNLVVEREDDLQESYLMDMNVTEELGYIVYRDRSFVHCPYCDGFCHATGVDRKSVV